MARTPGSRNQNFEERRLSLAAAMRTRLADRQRNSPSYADLAAAAGVSLATLRHYFGTRDEAVLAVLRLHAQLGEPHLERLRRAETEFAASIAAAADHIAEGLNQPLVAELHAVGLSEGLAHPLSGPGYVASFIEPMILALEDRLGQHMARGDMRPVDPRAAALTLISPLLIAHLHQRWLGGAQSRPLDEDGHRAMQVEAFVRAFSASVGL